MRNLLLLSALLSTIFSFSQNFEIIGVVKDQQNNLIESATVYVESVKDSTMISYTISDDKGMFELSGNTKEQMANFYVSYTGMQPIKKAVKFQKGVLNIGDLILKENSELLGEVIVVAERAPITIKKDTLHLMQHLLKPVQMQTLKPY